MLKGIKTNINTPTPPGQYKIIKFGPHKSIPQSETKTDCANLGGIHTKANITYWRGRRGEGEWITASDHRKERKEEGQRMCVCAQRERRESGGQIEETSNSGYGQSHSHTICHYAHWALGRDTKRWSSRLQWKHWKGYENIPRSMSVEMLTMLRGSNVSLIQEIKENLLEQDFEGKRYWKQEATLSHAGTKASNTICNLAEPIDSKTSAGRNSNDLQC